MAEDPKVILEKSDYDLMYWTLSGADDSYVHKIGESALTMRTALKMLEANKKLVAHTRGLAISTWGVVGITFLTQAALIYLTVTR